MGLTLALPVVPAAQGGLSNPRQALEAALDLYHSGEFDRAVIANPLHGIDVATAIERLTTWVGASSGERATDPPSRAQSAARFVVDVVAANEQDVMWIGLPYGDGAPLPSAFRLTPPVDLPGRPWPPRLPDQGATLPLIAWACRVMPVAGPLEPWERWWWYASIAALQRSGEWSALIGARGVVYGNKTPPEWEQLVRTEARDSHLVQARRRLGSDVRLDLAEATTRSALLTDATRRFTTGPPRWRLSVDGRYDVLRNLELAVRRLNSGPLNEIERLLQPLLETSDFEGEVALRIGFLRALRGDWDASRRWLDRAAETLPAGGEGELLATVDYLSGWVFERTNQPAAALDAYRRAYQRDRQSPGLNSLLAVQLVLAGERTEAARLLEATMRLPHDVGPRDLVTRLIAADGRHARTFAHRMREGR